MTTSGERPGDDPDVPCPWLSADQLFPPTQALDDLRRDVYLLALALSGHPAASHESTRCKKRDRPALALFQHVATILTTGYSSDGSQCEVAVMGHAEANKVVCAVFTSGTGGGGDGEGDRLEIKRVKPAGADSALELLYKWHSVQPVGLERHLQDVTTILSYLIHRAHPPFQEESPRLKTDFSRFIVRRTWIELTRRINSWSTVWSQQPLRIISDWFANEENRRAFEEPLSVKLDCDNLPESMRSFLTARGVNLTEPTLSSGNVLSWLEVLTWAWNNLTSNLPVLSDDSTSPSVPLGETATDNIVDAITTLDVFLSHSTFLENLITPALRARLRADCEECKSKREDRSKEELKEVLEAVKSNRSPLPTIDAQSTVPNPNTTQELLETPTDHLTRYFKDITGILRAILKIFTQVSSGQWHAVDVYHVNVTSSLKINDDLVEDFTNGYLARVGSSTSIYHKRAKAFLHKANLNDAIKRPISIHPEALLMTLSSNHIREILESTGVLSKADGEILRTIFATPKAPIGTCTGQKLCFCCHTLSNHLTFPIPPMATSLPFSPTTDYPHFLLPGTHGTITPWLVPILGVNVDVLRKMRSGLFDVFHRKACLHGEGRGEAVVVVVRVVKESVVLVDPAPGARRVEV
ncbi:hypothetical protein AX16_001946 [Volvariella volvacea WC 439]|nr:hypothetical protein AX16_001946 [Volvariella volvacea WC 439]